MPRNSNGQYSPPEGVIVTSGQTILPSQHNPFITDAGQALSDSLSRDGRGGMRNNLDMGGFSVQNIAAGVNPNDAATVSQIQSAAGVPVGSMFTFAGATAPAGYLACMGQSVSRAQYPALFTVIGTTYGSVNGSSFNLPDLRGRVVAGLDTQQGGTFADRLTSPDSRTLGATGGLQSVALNEAQMPKHDHAATSSAIPPHHHLVASTLGRNDNRITENTVIADEKTGGGEPSNYRFTQSTANTANAGKTSESASVTPTITVANAGNSEAHPNVQPTIVMNYIIKAF